jgi:hypothetical protein
MHTKSRSSTSADRQCHRLLLFVLNFSVIGAAIIVLGLYALIWGKSKDSVADVSASGGSKGASAAAAVELPITLAQPNGNGNCKHEVGSGRGVVFDVETPAANNGHY